MRGWSTAAVNLEVFLCQNVGYMRWLFARVLDGSADARQLLFVRELCEAFEARLQTIEEVVHPVLKSHGWRTGLPEATAQHASMRRLLAELVAGTKGGGLTTSALSDVSLRIEKALAAQGELVASASSALLTPDKLASLGSQVRKRLGHVGACVPESVHAEFRRECPARVRLVKMCPGRSAKKDLPNVNCSSDLAS
jgi:hypothetical protein